MIDNQIKREKEQPARPSPALKRLEILAGKWKMSGRMLNSEEDNITGEISGNGFWTVFFSS